MVAKTCPDCNGGDLGKLGAANCPTCKGTGLIRDWPPFVELPGKGQEPASFCWSPRMSYLGTAVTLSPEHYQEAREAKAKAALFDEMREPLKHLVSAVRGFLCADRQEHLMARFSDDEADKFRRIIEALGSANIVLERANKIAGGK
jgi:hypothetical protein